MEALRSKIIQVKHGPYNQYSLDIRTRTKKSTCTCINGLIAAYHLYS